MNWICIKDRLPNNNEDVLVLCRNNVEQSKYINGKFADKYIIGEWQDVTHWIPYVNKES